MRSLVENVRSLPAGKYETINQVRKLIGMSTENFEILLETLAKSNSASLTFDGALGTEVEISKIIDRLEANVKIDIARGEVTLRYSFAVGDLHTKISAEKLP